MTGRARGRGDESREAQAAVLLGEFDGAVRCALAFGVPGRELQERIVRVFDDLDGERASARDRDADNPYPLVRL